MPNFPFININGLFEKLIIDPFSEIVKKILIKKWKNKHQNMDSDFYDILMFVLNKITFNKYKEDENRIPQAAEIILKTYKNDKLFQFRANTIKKLSQTLDVKIDDEWIGEFKKKFYNELSKDENKDLYRNLILNKSDGINNDKTEPAKNFSKISRQPYSSQENDEGKNRQQKKQPENRTKEYADKWNSNMFLNNFDKRDEHPGTNINLKDVYLEMHLPHYIWGANTIIVKDLKKLLKEYIIENSEKKCF